MKYTGKLYGKVGKKYFDTGKTTNDYDELLETLKEIEAYINKMGIVSMAMNNIKFKAKSAIKKAIE